MNAAARVVGIELGVAGFTTIEEDALEKKLGYSAWLVWQILCARRDRQGVTRVTRLGIANAKGYCKLNERVVQDALARLRAAGLVEDIGWKECRVPKGTRFVIRKVFLRRVRGARQLCVGGTWRVSTPTKTRDWLKEAPGHGGKRMGAGRKKTPRGTESSTANSESSTANTPHLPAESSTATEYLNVPIGSSRSGGEASPNGEATHSPKPARTTPFQVLHAGGVEIGFTGSAKRTQPMPSTPIPGLPPYPGWSVLAPAQVPEPPKLNPEDPEEFRVRLLAAAFRGAVDRQYGGKTYLLANLSERAPSYKSLVKAARLLAQFDVSPYAWCIYAVRRWWLARTHTIPNWKQGDKVPLPPVSVIFSEKQITEKLADEKHHEAVVSSAQGGNAQFGKTHTKLLKVYAEMRAAIMRGMDTDAAREKFFPGTTYDDMVDASKAEAIDIRNRIDLNIKRGNIPW